MTKRKVPTHHTPKPHRPARAELERQEEIHEALETPGAVVELRPEEQKPPKTLLEAGRDALGMISRPELYAFLREMHHYLTREHKVNSPQGYALVKQLEEWLAKTES